MFSLKWFYFANSNFLAGTINFCQRREAKDQILFESPKKKKKKNPIKVKD